MRFVALAVAFTFGLSAGTASAATLGDGSLADGGHETVGIIVTAPGSGAAGSAADAGRPLIGYTVSWSIDPTAAQPGGGLNGLCLTADSTPGHPIFGFEYHLVGSDATGAIVDDRFVCIALVPTAPGQRPPLPALPAVPTFGEAWNHAQLPAPVVTLDPSGRGITGLDTRITAAGVTTVTIGATIRGYTITGTATLDHYAISVDGQAATNAGTGHYTFETKGNHTVAVSAVWHGTATITGPNLPGTLPAIDLGSATVTATRTYPVHEIRSVLQP